MGKDNIVFHSVIWPAQLLGYGHGGELGAGRGALQLPYDIVSSEFLTMEGRQFSTSRNVVIHVGDFLDRYDADSLRYYLTAAGPETQDTDFTWAEFVRRTNDELVATWGNLVNRTLQSAFRHFGSVPEPREPHEADRAVLAEVDAGFGAVGEEIERARFRNALAEAMALAGRVNRYLSAEAPWAMLESDRARAGTILYTRAPLRRRSQAPAHPVPAAHVPAAPRVPGVRGVDRRPARAPRRRAGGRQRPHRTHGGLRDVGRSLGAESVAAGSEAPGTVAALRQARLRSSGRLGARAYGKADRLVIDTHAHLDACEDDPGEMLARAREAGVTRVVTIGTGIDSCRRAVAIAGVHDGVVAALGIDPHQAATPEAERIGELRALLAEPRVVAVGESGLDGYHGADTLLEQRALLDAHLALAEELGLPVVIHSRAASAETAAALAPFRGTVVLHCFSELELLELAVERRYYVSFAGNVTYPKAEALRSVAAQVPADRILAETDSPYLSPQPVRGRRNEPANVMHTLAVLAAEREETASELEMRIEENADRAFGLGHP